VDDPVPGADLHLIRQVNIVTSCVDIGRHASSGHRAGDLIDGDVHAAGITASGLEKRGCVHRKEGHPSNHFFASTL
jgi:hypothetical protein